MCLGVTERRNADVNQFYSRRNNTWESAAEAPEKKASFSVMEGRDET
jgi:hypothetical protein